MGIGHSYEVNCISFSENNKLLIKNASVINYVFIKFDNSFWI